MSVPTTDPFDARPLTAPVDRRQLRAFIAQTDTADERTGLGVMFGFWVFFIVLLQVIVLVVLIIKEGNPFSPRSAGMMLGIAVLGGVLIGVVGLIYWIRWLHRRPDHKARFRIAGFAYANGWTYLGSIPNPPHPGMIFTQGMRRLSTAVVQVPAPRPIEIGNHRFVFDDSKDGSSSNTRLSTWGYAALGLRVPLPNIVLRASGEGRLAVPPAASQRLSLEGDFDRHFTLYCPAGYETDALYLFTPDVLAQLVDHAGTFHVEIVDNRVYLYDRDELSTTDPAQWYRVFRALAALAAKLDQWERWRDVRLQKPDAADGAPAGAGFTASASPPPSAPPAPPGVAPRGRRLKKAVPWVSIIAGLLWVAFWIAVKVMGW